MAVEISPLHSSTVENPPISIYSEVFRFEELAFELITPGFYRVFFRDIEVGELNEKELRFRAARRMV